MLVCELRTVLLQDVLISAEVSKYEISTLLRDEIAGPRTAAWSRMPLGRWLLDKTTLAQIGERIIGGHRRQARHPTTTHRHDHLPAGRSVPDVPAEPVMRLTHSETSGLSGR